MGKLIKETLKMVKSMALVYINGQMDQFSKVGTLKIENKAMENLEV